MNLRRLLKKSKKKQSADQMTRLDTSQEEMDGHDKGTRKIINLLNYTKRSASAYDGAAYDVGYHSFKINGKQLKGQRDPEQRLAKSNYDFTGKTVLDIGCNQGGMLFPIADKISHGIGIDFDSRMINAANRIRSYQHAPHLDFYVFDLQKERLEFINDFFPGNKVDICFLLSVCRWLENWKDVINFAQDVSCNLLFESNGNDGKQEEQINYLKQLYRHVELLSATSDDDAGRKKRQFLMCSNELRAA